jgi:hypothetical protein
MERNRNGMKRDSREIAPVAATVENSATTRTKVRGTLARYTDKPDPLRMKSAVGPKGSNLFWQEMERHYSANMVMIVNGAPKRVLPLATRGFGF